MSVLYAFVKIMSGTWNIPEHRGTSNNYDNYEKNICKLKFSKTEKTSYLEAAMLKFIL